MTTLYCKLNKAVVRDSVKRPPRGLSLYALCHLHELLNLIPARNHLPALVMGKAHAGATKPMRHFLLRNAEFFAGCFEEN